MTTSVPSRGRRLPGTGISTSLAWWRGELTGCLPSRLREIGEPDRPSYALTVLGSQGQISRRLGFGLVRPQKSTLVLRANWPASLDHLSKALPALRAFRSVELCFPIDRCLVRDKRIPRQALDKAEQILALDLQQSSPFGIADVVYDWQMLPGGDPRSPVRVRQIILKRATLQPLLDDLTRSRIDVSAVRVVDGTGAELPVDLLKRLKPARRSLRWVHRAIMATSVLVLATLAATACVDLWRYETAIQELEHENDALKKQATAIRNQLADAAAASDQLARLRLYKIDQIPAVQVWEDVTRLLPGTTWLTELRIENDVITLDGLSKSASELIGILSGSPIFRSVEFASPVTRDNGQAAERFQIRMKVGRWSEKKTAAKPSQGVQ